MSLRQFTRHEFRAARAARGAGCSGNKPEGGGGGTGQVALEAGGHCVCSLGSGHIVAWSCMAL